MHFLAEFNGKEGQSVGFCLAKVPTLLLTSGKIHAFREAGGV